MGNKDHLKEILENIDEVNEPIDLEGIILKAIQKEEHSKVQIAHYKAKGIKALVLSGILFSLPNSVRSFESSMVTYTSMVLTLLILFIQLEMGRTRIFNNQKNNLS